MPYTKDELMHWITMIQEEGREVTKWEEEFVESVKDQLERRGSLSDRQIEILERIYSERTA